MKKLLFSLLLFVFLFPFQKLRAEEYQPVVPILGEAVQYSSVDKILRVYRNGQWIDIRYSTPLPPQVTGRIMLDVPYRSQNEGWELNDCGETSLAMVYQYHTGIVADINAMNAKTPGQNLRSISDLKIADDALGHNFQYWNNYAPTSGWQWSLKNHKPYVTHIVLDSGVGHYVVITGMIRYDNGVYLVRYHDPLNGANRWMDSDEYARRTVASGYWGIEW